jgi:acetyl-CoA decarbonylase/synthase complex subunit gamma
MRYRVEPGLFAAGSPGNDSPVLVTANFKMSFDRVRSHLAGIDAWILVLDTEGINVWCAAGGGKFSTDRLVKGIEEARLKEVVAQGTLVLPQLSAPGVCAHEVKRLSGFPVVYGPVRASDIPAFLASDMVATGEMRRVSFDLAERAVLIPVEIVTSAKYLLPAALFLFLLPGIGGGGYILSRAVSVGSFSVGVFFWAFIGGAVLAPLFLPWLPGRSFSFKGAFLGLILSGIYALYAWGDPGSYLHLATMVSWLLMIPAVTSFLSMNFTGSSTYTSLSGVRKEMRYALPVQVVFALAGIGLWLAGVLL